MSTKLCSTFLLNYKVVGEPVVYKLGVLFPTPLRARCGQAYSLIEYEWT